MTLFDLLVFETHYEIHAASSSFLYYKLHLRIYDHLLGNIQLHVYKISFLDGYN